MVEYLKNYQKLLELQKNNQKAIKDIELIINKTNQKWAEEKEKEEILNLEIQKLNEEYGNIKNKQIKRVYNKTYLILAIISIIILLPILLFNHPIIALLCSSPVVLADGIICMIVLLIIEKTNFIENKLTKDENAIKLLEQIKTKEKELSNVKELINDYVQKVIQCRSKLKKMQENENWYDETINELMRSYAQPIFEEQLKNYQEAEKEENSELKQEQPKRKTRSQITREKRKLTQNI